MANESEDKPRIYETKEELARKLAEKDEIIADLQHQLDGREAALRGTSEPGWLITTKNTAYVGTVMGVHFENGRGFLPKAVKNARRTMLQLASDFGYDVQEITAKEFEASRKPVVAAEPSTLEKISQPNFVN